MENRKKPFTVLEKEIINNLIQQHVQIIECKETDSKVTRKKNVTWERITEEFNQSMMVQERVSTKQLRKFWLNAKAKARNEKTKENQRKMTGGGPSIPNMDPEDERVLAVAAPVLPTVKSIDCDNYIASDADDNDDSWTPGRYLLDSMPIVIEETEQAPGTPISQANTAQGVQTPTVIQSVLKSKRPKLTGPSIDDMKKQLYQDEIENRKELHKLNIDHEKIFKGIQLEREKLFLKEQELRMEHDKKIREIQLAREESLLKEQEARTSLAVLQLEKLQKQ